MSWVDILANIPTNAVLRQKLGELTAEFEALEMRIAELEQENEDLRTQVHVSNSEPHDIEIQILEILGNTGDYIQEENFARRLGIPPAKAEHYLNSLLQQGYIETSLHVMTGMMTGVSYKLSQKGSTFLIETGRL